MSEPRWIRIEERPTCATHGRRSWIVLARQDGFCLGEVVWYPQWRRFIFSPTELSCVAFEETCLRDIAEFVEARTREHREALQARKSVSV